MNNDADDGDNDDNNNGVSAEACTSIHYICISIGIRELIVPDPDVLTSTDNGKQTYVPDWQTATCHVFETAIYENNRYLTNEYMLLNSTKKKHNDNDNANANGNGN